MDDQELSKFYQNSNLSVVKNKYTYYLAVQLGTPLDLIFPDLYEVHEKVSKNSESPILDSHFEKMKEYFVHALK